METGESLPGWENLLRSFSNRIKPPFSCGFPFHHTQRTQSWEVVEPLWHPQKESQTTQKKRNLGLMQRRRGLQRCIRIIQIFINQIISTSKPWTSIIRSLFPLKTRPFPSPWKLMASPWLSSITWPCWPLWAPQGSGSDDWWPGRGYLWLCQNSYWKWPFIYSGCFLIFRWIALWFSTRNC